MSFDWTPEELQQVVDENQIVIFMKGTPEQPQCGFSARGAQESHQHLEQTQEAGLASPLED